MSAVTSACLDPSWPGTESRELGAVPGWPVWLKNTGKMTQMVYASVSLLVKKNPKQIRLPLEFCNKTGALLAWSQFRAWVTPCNMFKVRPTSEDI